MMLLGIFSTLLLSAAPIVDGPGSTSRSENVRKFQRGVELTYSGNIVEVVDLPGTRYERSHDLEIRVFVIERGQSWVDAAVMTVLRRNDDRTVLTAVGTVTGRKYDRQPPAAQLDLLRIHDDGSVYRIEPTGPLPLRYPATLPERSIPPTLLDTYSPFEFGMFPPHLAEDGVASLASTDPGRPVEKWTATGFETVNSERCLKLSMNQQSVNWKAPIGGKSAWQREDQVWVSTLDSAARRVDRTILHRDGFNKTPSISITVHFKLKDQARLIGRTYDTYRREIEMAYLTAMELAPLLKTAAKIGPKPFESRLAQLAHHIEKEEPTPYRAALLAVKRQLEAAQNGEATPGVSPSITTDLQSQTTKKDWVGQTAPDFRSADFHLASTRGSPVVLIFFMPGSETTELTLVIAKALHKKYGDRIAVVPLELFVVQEHTERNLSIPIRDGTPAEALYCVESVPRFLVLDAGGIIRWDFTGVGGETGYLVKEQLEALLNRRSDKSYPPEPGGITGSKRP